jgi:hypothetical protein
VISLVEEDLLYKILYDKKKKEIIDILNDSSPIPDDGIFNSRRIYLVKFLKAVGYGLDEVLNIVLKMNRWSTYRGGECCTPSEIKRVTIYFFNKDVNVAKNDMQPHKYCGCKESW